jgi:hypothetical protein
LSLPATWDLQERFVTELVKRHLKQGPVMEKASARMDQAQPKKKIILK